MDYDKLTLELETDGSIKASDAVATAATILMNCFELFRPLATGPILEARDGSDMARQSSDQQAEEEKSISPAFRSKNLNFPFVHLTA